MKQEFYKGYPYVYKGRETVYLLNWSKIAQVAEVRFKSSITRLVRLDDLELKLI